MPRLTQYFCVAFLAVAAGKSACAQNSAMMELYGQGVHSYFCHDYAGAEQLLSQVVASGSEDPRAHYFLGLTREKMGFDSAADFATGARLEAEGRRVVQVGQALARVQGHTRSKIEKARRSARLVALQQKLAEQAKRAKMVPQADPAAIPPTPSVTDSPFNEGMTSPDKVPAAEAAAPIAPPAAATPDDNSNPFGDDPEPAEGSSPFDTVPEATESNPFGGDAGTDAPELGNPFGTDGDNPFPAGDDIFN